MLSSPQVTNEGMRMQRSEAAPAIWGPQLWVREANPVAGSAGLWHQGSQSRCH